MGIWFGFPLTFIICAICALLGITRVVPVWLAVTAIVVCVAVCWICCFRNTLRGVKFAWRYLRDAYKEQNQCEIAQGRKWLMQKMLWLIFSPLAVIVSVVLSIVFLVLENIRMMLDKFGEKASA